jgi:hypothetical protein
MNSISPVSYTPQMAPRVESTPKVSQFELDGSAGTAMAASGVMQRELSEKGLTNDTVNMVNNFTNQIVQSRMMVQTAQTYAASANAASNDDSSTSNDLDATVIRINEPMTPTTGDDLVEVTPYGGTVSERLAGAYNAAGSPAPTTRRFEAYA